MIRFRHISLWILLCYTAVVPLTAQQYAVSDIHPHLFTQATAVHRVHETTIRILNSSEMEITELLSATILHKDAEAQAVWTDYESDFVKLKSLEGRLYDGEGQLMRVSKKSEIKDHGTYEGNAYADQRIKVLDMSAHRYPYTVEFKAKKVVHGFFTIPYFVAQPVGTSVEKAVFRLIAPSDYSFLWKGIQTKGQPVVEKQEKRTEWRWAFEDMAARPEEPCMPDSNAVMIYIAPTSVTIDNHNGLFDTWTNVGRFFYELNKDRDQLSEETRKHILQIVEYAPDRRSKIDTLYRYLQKNCRYISIQTGIGGWQTLSADFVETNKYGDCKALSNYMKAMLAAAGIPSYQALIYADKDHLPPFHEDVPVPWFNHAILYVPQEDLWLECTSKQSPCGWLGSFTANRLALLLTPEGGQLRKTPSYGIEQNKRETKTDIYPLEENQNARIHTRILVSGEEHDTYRSLNDQPLRKRQERWAEETGLSVVEWQNFSSSCQEGTPRCTIDCDILSGSYTTRTGKRLFVPLLKPHAFTQVLPEDKDRQWSLEVSESYMRADTVVLHCPQGYVIETAPKEMQMQTAYGSYTFKIEKADTTLTLVRTLTILPVSVAAEKYGEVRQFYLQMFRNDQMQAVLTKR